MTSEGKGELLQRWLSRLEASKKLGDILIQFKLGKTLDSGVAVSQSMS